MDRHIARTIVRNSAGDARVIWSIFSGYHPQELRESGGLSVVNRRVVGAVVPCQNVLPQREILEITGREK